MKTGMNGGDPYHGMEYVQMIINCFVHVVWVDMVVRMAQSEDGGNPVSAQSVHLRMRFGSSSRIERGKLCMNEMK